MLSLNLPFEWLPLADAIAKATLILAAASGISFALRRGSAAARHLVWTLALCSAVVLPALSFALPKWQLPIVTIASPAASPAFAVEADTSRPPAAPPRRQRASDAPVAPSPASQATGHAGGASAAPTSLRMTWQQALFAIWLTGALMILGRLAAGLVAVRWLSRRTQEITDAPWLPMAGELAEQVGVRGRLRFLRSGRATMPVAAGIFRPSVIMPADADTWSAERLRVVLLHELAHVKRRDCLTHLIAQIACACYWFNPLTWIAARKARTERERACDDLVLATGTRGSDYADQLLDIARTMRGQRLAGLLSGASLAMAHQSQLEGRLIAILDPRLSRAGISRARAIAAVALCICAVAPLGALQPWTAEAPGSVAERGAVEPPVAAESVVPPDRPVVTTRPDADRAPAADQRTSAAQAQEPLPSPNPVPEPRASAAPLPLPMVADVAGPIAEAAVAAVAGALEGAFEGAVEGALQDDAAQKTKPGKATAAPRDPRMIAALTAALKDSDKDVRETAMQALVRLRDPSVFEPLVQALKDASPDVREQAASGLGQMRDRRAAGPLGEALKDTHANVREQAVFALGQLRDRSSVPVLIGALKDTSASVREQAAFALGQMKDPAAIDALSAAVQDASPSVREQAVFALSQIRDRRAVQPLISALKDANADVREQAAFALGQLRDTTALDALMVAVKDTSASVREQVVFALGRLRDPRAIDALTTALKDQSASVRQQAAFALGQLAR